MAQVYKNVIFRNKIGIPTILGQEAPSFRKYFRGNALPLIYRGTRRLIELNLSLNTAQSLYRYLNRSLDSSIVRLIILAPYIAQFTAGGGSYFFPCDI